MLQAGRPHLRCVYLGNPSTSSHHASYKVGIQYLFDDLEYRDESRKSFFGQFCHYMDQEHFLYLVNCLQDIPTLMLTSIPLSPLGLPLMLSTRLQQLHFEDLRFPQRYKPLPPLLTNLLLFAIPNRDCYNCAKSWESVEAILSGTIMVNIKYVLCAGHHAHALYEISQRSLMRTL